MTYSVIGEKSKQEPVWKGPLDTLRFDTDLSFLVLFCISMSVWVLVSIYAFVAGDVLEIHYSNTFHHLDVFEVSYFISRNIYKARYIIVGFITLTVLLLAAYIAMFRWATRALLLITVFLITLGLVLDYIIVAYRLIDRGSISGFVLTLNIVITVAYGLIMYAFKKTGTEMLCKVIKESCKAMFFFPSTLLFTVCEFFLHLAVFIYAASIFEFLNAIKEPSADYESSNDTLLDSSGDRLEESPAQGLAPDYIYVLHAINIFCFLWASSFIGGLGRTVLTAAFATWYHVNENDEVPKATLLKCFIAIVSYHSGTIAYAASLFSLIPMVDIICRYGRDTLKKIYKRPVLLMSWLTVLMKFSFDALALCAIHGSAYYESAKDSYILLMKNPMSYLAVNTVSECIIFLGLLFVPLLSIGSTVFYLLYCVDSEEDGQMKGAACMIIAITSILMSLTCFMVFRAASNTIRCCYLEDSKFNREAEMKLYEIHVDDISIREDNP